jgi:hypothetical protein
VGGYGAGQQLQARVRIRAAARRRPKGRHSLYPTPAEDFGRVEHTVSASRVGAVLLPANVKKPTPARSLPTPPRRKRQTAPDGGQPNKRLGRPPDLLSYFGDKETALQFLESSWGPPTRERKVSPWAFVETSRLWADLTGRPDTNKQSFVDLKAAAEVLKKVAAKLHKSRIEMQSAVVWVRERVGNSVRRVAYEISVGSTAPRVRFRHVVPAKVMQGLHSFEHRLPTSVAIDDAVWRALTALEAFGLDEAQHEDLRHRLELWCSRYFGLKLERGQYLNAAPLLLLLLDETAAALGLRTPSAEETHALELIATERTSGEQAATDGDVKQANDRWRKALAGLPRWRALMTPTERSSP